jgi:hypothetical protein
MVSMTGCTVTPAIHGGFRQLGSQTTENVKAQLQQEKCDLVIIPGGMTRMLQPLDVIINQPLKAHIRRSYSEWAQKTHKVTPTGRLKRATLTEMCWWILEDWQSVSQDMIEASKLLASATRWTGVRTISCGIGLTKKSSKKT